jgi:hypothetical protein
MLTWLYASLYWTWLQIQYILSAVIYLKMFYKYSNDPTSGPSSFGMVIFRTLFRTGFQMVTKWPTIWKPDNFFSTASLYHFIIKHFLFYDCLLIIKKSRLVRIIRQPDTNRPFQNWNRPVFRCSLHKDNALYSSQCKWYWVDIWVYWWSE